MSTLCICMLGGVDMDLVRVLTYNIRHGKGMDEKVSLKRIKEVLFSSRVHLCGLQEVDKHNPRSYLVHQAKVLARRCRMNYVFGANVKAVFTGYGNAILSLNRIIDYNNYQLPGTGEKRGLLRSVILVGGQKINFYTTHLGLNEQQRVQQVEYILDVVSQNPGPTIIAGDFNEEPDGQGVSLLLKESTLINCLPPQGGLIPTFPSNSPKKHIDFIFASPNFKVMSAKAINTQASDHLPYLVELFRNP